MPDIAMCQNERCPFKGECYRYMAKPSLFSQSYADFECESKDVGYFVPMPIFPAPLPERFHGSIE